MSNEKAAGRGDRILFGLTCLAFVLILFFPGQTGEGVRTGLSLCYAAVIPSVFPSLILTDLLFSRPTDAIECTVGRLFSRFFRVSPRGAVAWVSGLLSGFPVGALVVSDDVRKGLLSREEGAYLLSFVNNTGPSFLVGGIGIGLFRSAALGWSLYLLQIPISLFVGFLLRPKKAFPSKSSPQFPPTGADPVSSIVRAAESCVRIAGFVCFFSVISSLLKTVIPGGFAFAAVTSFLEIGSGALAASRLSFPFPALPLLAFAVCFSGLSVHFQTIALLSDAKLDPGKYKTGKTLSGVIALLLSLLFCLTK